MPTHDNTLSAHQTRVIAALAESRKARHHPTCRCHSFENLYCSAADAVWQRAVNRELNNIAKLNTGSTP